MASTERRHFSRRGLLAATAGVVGLAGCTGGDSADPTESANGTPATSTPNTGGTIGGLRLWLHPDSGRDTSNSGVSEWRDDSGNGNHVEQSTADWQPTVAGGAANGNDALQFDGTDDFLLRRDTLGIPDDSDRTFVVVSRLSDTESRSPSLMQGEFDTTGGDSSYYGLEANTFRTAGERFGLYLVSSAKDTPRQTDTRYNLHVLRTRNFPDIGDIEPSTTYRINGADVSFSGTSGGTRNQTLTADSTAIGSFPTSQPGSAMSGEIAEVRVYDRAVTDDERNRIESDLMDKYGIGQPPSTASS